MRALRTGPLLGLLLAIMTTSCAPAPSSAPASGPAAPGVVPAPAAPKRITVAMLGEMPAFWDNLNPGGGTVPGAGQFKVLASSGLTAPDENQTTQAQLGEAAPTIDNGLWKLFPDGAMELTFRIREGARWHDGEPFTTDDLLFTVAAGQDPDVRVFKDPAYELLDGVDALD